MPFEEGQSTDCTITATSVLVINCPERNFIYKTESFAVNNNKGVDNFGTDTQLQAVKKVVEKYYHGKIAVLDSQAKEITALFPQTAIFLFNLPDIGRAKLLNYDLDSGREVTDFVIFDFEYLVAVIDSKEIAFFDIRGLQKTQN